MELERPVHAVPASDSFSLATERMPRGRFLDTDGTPLTNVFENVEDVALMLREYIVALKGGVLLPPEGVDLGSHIHECRSRLLDILEQNEEGIRFCAELIGASQLNQTTQSTSNSKVE
jgi:hypothetical protein